MPNTVGSAGRSPGLDVRDWSARDWRFLAGGACLATAAGVAVVQVAVSYELAHPAGNDVRLVSKRNIDIATHIANHPDEGGFFSCRTPKEGAVVYVAANQLGGNLTVDALLKQGCDANLPEETVPGRATFLDANAAIALLGLKM